MIFTLQNAVIVTMIVLVHKCKSQAYLPLFPCYSVHKIQTTDNSVHYYRFVANLVMLSNDSETDCVFTIEGPPGSSLQLQLFNVVLQKPGYVSTTQSDDNCPLGLIQIYNLTASGALVQAQKVCGSFMAGPLIRSDTNIAMVTTTITQGQFDLHITIQQNIKSALRSGSTQDMDNIRVIHLGYENEITEDLDKPTEKQTLQQLLEYLQETFRNASLSAIKASATNTKFENQKTDAMESTQEANKDSQDDSVNYVEYDYEYEPDEESHTSHEEPSDTEEKLPLENLFDLHAKPKKLKRITSNKKLTQFVDKAKHHSETKISSTAVVHPDNSTMETKVISQSNGTKVL